MQTKAFRVGVIGAGAVASKYHVPVLVALPGVSVEWVCDLDLQKAEALARSFKIPRAFSKLADVSNVDAVLIAIPIGARAQSWQAALDRKWHVLCEKPFATNVAWHRDLQARAAERGLRVAVGQMRRFFPNVELCRSVVGSGIFGRIREIVANDGGRMRGTGRGGDWYQGSAEASGGGGMAETGCHLIDQMVFATDIQRLSFSNASGTFVDGIDFDGVIDAEGITATGDTFPCEMTVSRIANRRAGVHIKYDHCFLSLPVGIGDSVAAFDYSGNLITLLRAETTRDISIYRAFARQWDDFVAWCRGVGECRTASSKIEPVSDMLERFYATAPQANGGAR